MKKKNYKRKRGPVQAKKVTYDGIKFASGLELNVKVEQMSLFLYVGNYLKNM